MTARPERCCLPHPIELTQLADVALHFEDGTTVHLCHGHRDWWDRKAQDDPQFEPTTVDQHPGAKRGDGSSGETVVVLAAGSHG